REARQLDKGVCASNDPVCCSVPEPNIPVSAQPSPPCEIWTDAEIVKAIRRAGPADQDYTALMDFAFNPLSTGSSSTGSRLCVRISAQSFEEGG
ncbi:uncharacterized protein VP01_6270g1, partial [Puccinia sorghi]